METNLGQFQLLTGSSLRFKMLEKGVYPHWSHEAFLFWCISPYSAAGGEGRGSIVVMVRTVRKAAVRKAKTACHVTHSSLGKSVQ